MSTKKIFKLEPSVERIKVISSDKIKKLCMSFGKS